MPDDDFESPVTELLQTDQLDLHTFQPSEAASVTAEFLTTAQDEGYRTVRIIHGKGSGQLRQTVDAVLEKHPRSRATRWPTATGARRSSS